MSLPFIGEKRGNKFHSVLGVSGWGRSIIFDQFLVPIQNKGVSTK